MRQLRQAKVQLVLRQFEEQLKKDAMVEQQRQQMAIQQEMDRRLAEITKQKERHLGQIEELKACSESECVVKAETQY
jgi:hypothetical protein